jgi:hypothetical protein
VRGWLRRRVASSESWLRCVICGLWHSIGCTGVLRHQSRDWVVVPRLAVVLLIIIFFFTYRAGALGACWAVVIVMAARGGRVDGVGLPIRGWIVVPWLTLGSRWAVIIVVAACGGCVDGVVTFWSRTRPSVPEDGREAISLELNTNMLIFLYLPCWDGPHAQR